MEELNRVPERQEHSLGRFSTSLKVAWLIKADPPGLRERGMFKISNWNVFENIMLPSGLRTYKRLMMMMMMMMRDRYRYRTVSIKNLGH